MKRIRRQLCLIVWAGSLLLGPAVGSHAVTLDRSGTLPDIQVTCSGLTKAVKVCPGNPKHAYEFGGNCVVHFNGATTSAPGLSVEGIYDTSTHVAMEVVKTSDGKTISGQYSCAGDPWLGSSLCTVAAYSSSTGMSAFDSLTGFGNGVPFSRTLTNATEAASLSNCSGGSVPPPPPPKTKPKLQISAQTAAALIAGLKPPAPIIHDPSQDWAACTAVPFDVTTSGTPQDPNHELTIEFQDVKSGCSNLNSDACWEDRPVTGYAQPLSQAAINTTIPRSAFPGFGHWRVRARVKTVKGFTSDFSAWRSFRVPGNQACP